MGAFFTPSEEPDVKRAKRSAATLLPGSSHGTCCAAIAEQLSAVARSLWRKTLSLSPPCGWVHFKLPKWVKSTLALTPWGSGKANACGGSIRPVWVRTQQAASNEAGKATREGRKPTAEAVG